MFDYGFFAKLIRVVDGDTLWCEVDQGFRTRTDIQFRLYGVDTPEKYGVKKGSAEYKRGVAATNYVKQWFQENAPDDKIYVKSYLVDGFKTGSFKRWLAKVYALDGTCLNDDLIKTGHAKEYKRGK